jgi:hypothetical protein
LFAIHTTPGWNPLLASQPLSQPRPPRKSRSVANGPFKTGDDFPDGAVPENGNGCVLPLLVRRKEYGLVPEEAIIPAAKWFRLSRLGHSGSAQFDRNKMFRIPELPDSSIWYPRKGAAGRGAPVGCEYGLPDHQDMQFRVGVTFEKLFDCGGPPQAVGSGWREQQ